MQLYTAYVICMSSVCHLYVILFAYDNKYNNFNNALVCALYVPCMLISNMNPDRHQHVYF